MIKIKRFRWVGLVACVGEEEYLQGFCGKPEGRRPFGRPRCRWEGHINPLKPELYPICYLLVLLAHHFLHVSRIRVKSLTFR
jgi:hypothetical protein